MNKLIENTIFTAIAVLMTAFPAVVFSQGSAPPPKPDPKAAPSGVGPKTPAPPPPRPSGRSRDTTERSMKVDPAINLEFACIIEGKIKVNGWNRKEVRVYVANGSKFAFRTAESNPKTNDAVWVKVVGNDARRPGAMGECLSGSEIEVDAPTTATIRLNGREISSRIDSVKRAEIQSIGGDISLRNLTGGATANAYRGDITVESSTGPMQLSTTTGSILVFDAGPSGIGDALKANTNSGAISLHGLEYRQVTVDSVSGSLGYEGPILAGATYNLRTQKGSIRLAYPKTSVFQIFGTYVYGSFSTDIEVDITTETIAGVGPVKSFSGTAGKATRGSAVVKVTTANGSIVLKGI